MVSVCWMLVSEDPRFVMSALIRLKCLSVEAQMRRSSYLIDVSSVEELGSSVVVMVCGGTKSFCSSTASERVLKWMGVESFLAFIRELQVLLRNSTMRNCHDYNLLKSAD